MSSREFRRMALALESASESAHMGHPDFRVNGRIFATLHQDLLWGMVALTPGQQQTFVQEDPASFSPEAGAWGRSGCTKVRLDAVDEETLGAAMTLAWQNTIKKRAARKAKGKKVLLAILAALIFSAAASAQPQGSLAITRVTIIDTIRGEAITDSTVTIARGAIVSVTRNGAPPAGAQVVDGRGKFLIPGLWDMHAHHQLTGEASLPLFVATGVTGTRDMGADLELILTLRQRTASGQALGPIIVAAGPILDNRPPDWPFRLTVRSADDARKAVQTLKAQGVDLIKVHTATPADAYFAIAEESRKHNLPFAGHLPRGVTFEQAAAAGQRSIEHLDSGRAYTQCSGGQAYSAQQCRPFFSWLAKSGMWQTPTLVNWRKMFTLGTPDGNPEEDHFAYASPQMREFLAVNRKMSNVTPEGVRAMIAMSDTAAIAASDMQRAGVGILAGCDGMVAGFCLHDELTLMVRGGMSAAAALQTATINPARYLGLEGTLGSVAVGKRADLVLLDANPLDDIANVSRIHAVVIGGRLLGRQQLDETLKAVREQFLVR